MDEEFFPISLNEKILHKYCNYLYYGGTSVFLLKKNNTKFVRKAYLISKFDLHLYKDCLFKIQKFAKTKKCIVYVKNINISKVNDLQYLIYYDMKKVKKLSKTEKELFDYYVADKDPMSIIKKQNIKLKNFMNKYSKHFVDKHSGNIGKDSSGNYLFIDVEGSALFVKTLTKELYERHNR